MSLLDNPPHTITVFPVVAADDGYGGTLPGEGAPVTVAAHVQPSEASTADSADGYSTSLTYRVTSRSLPAGAWSRVVFDGDDWTVVGEVRRYGTSPRTAHDMALIRKR